MRRAAILAVGALLATATHLGAQDLTDLIATDCTNTSSEDTIGPPVHAEGPAAAGRRQSTAAVRSPTEGPPIATFEVSVTGTVLSAPEGPLVEGDPVAVRVRAARQLFPRLRIHRSTPTRLAHEIRTLGADAGPLPGPRVTPTRGSCATHEFILRDFAPGEARVTITVVQADKDRELGSFAFPVAPLYTGALTFGPVRSEVTGNGDSYDVLYSVMYTHFVAGRRSSLRQGEWYRHVNPTIGLVLNDVSEHVLVGISLDYLPFFLTTGVHAAENDGNWDSGPFVGISFDLRAAVQLVKAAIKS